MALSLNDRKVIRLMIRDGVSDETIDLIAADDTLALTEIASYKAAILPSVLRDIENVNININSNQEERTKLINARNILQ